MPEDQLPIIATEFMNNSLYVEIVDVPADELDGGGEPIPAWNGRLLMNPAGTVWVVLDGIARGYRNADLLDRVHGWRRKKLRCAGPLGQQTCSRVWTNTVFHRISTISVIKVGPPIALDATMISNRAGTVFFFENNRIRGIPSPDVMEKYQFNWGTSKKNRYSDDVIMRLDTGTIIR